MALACRIVTDFAELESISGQWERIISAKESHARGSIFQCWNWARACWAERESNVRLYTPVVTESKRVIAIMPLVLDRHMLRWLGSPYADYNDLVCESPNLEAITACFETLLTSSHWTSCVLDNVADSSAMFPLSTKLTTELHRRFVSVPRFAYSSVREDGSGILEQMSRKRSFRQHENQLRRAGNSLVFRHIEDRAEIRSHLDDFFAMHISRSALNGRRSLFASHSAQRFFRRLVDTMSPESDLRFAVLQLDGRAMAYHFGFQKSGQLICYVTTFHVDYWDLSPGEVLFRNLFKYAHDSELDELDLTIGDETYKSRFANVTGKTYTIYFHRNLTSPKAVVTRLVRSVEGRIRQEPAAFDLAHRVITTSRHIRSALGQLPVTFGRHGQNSPFTANLRVSLQAKRSVFCDEAVERVTLQSLGLYVDNRNIDVGPSRLGQFRNNFKRAYELYRVAARGSEFLLWKSGDDLWEDPLTLASPTRHFGFAIAALQRHTTLKTAFLTTRRRNSKRWLSVAGLWIEKSHADSQLTPIHPAHQTDLFESQPQ